MAIAGGVALLLALAAGAAFVVLPRIVLRHVLREAAARGVDLQVGGVEVGFGSLVLHDVSFTLRGVHGVSGTMETADVALSGTRPLRLTIGGLSLAIEGTAFVSGLVAWNRERAA